MLKHQNLEMPSPAGSLHSAPSLDEDNLFAAIVDYSKASSELANHNSLFFMCIDRATISRIRVEAAR